MKNKRLIIECLEQADQHGDIKLNLEGFIHDQEGRLLIVGSRIEELAYLTSLLISLQDFDGIKRCEEDYIGVATTLIQAAKWAFGQLFYRTGYGGVCITLLDESAQRSAEEFCDRVRFCKDYLNHLSD